MSSQKTLPAGVEYDTARGRGNFDEGHLNEYKERKKNKNISKSKNINLQSQRSKSKPTYKSSNHFTSSPLSNKFFYSNTKDVQK